MGAGPRSRTGAVILDIMRDTSTTPATTDPAADSGPGTAAEPSAARRTGLVLSRRVSWFLLAFGVWSWFVWITFVKNLWKDSSGLAFDDAGDPTGYFWVHLLLAITSFLLGTAIGLIGLRGLRAARRD